MLIEGPPDADALVALAGRRRTCGRRWRCWSTRPTSRGRAALLAVRGVLARVAGDPLGRRARRPGAVHATCRRALQLAASAPDGPRPTWTSAGRTRPRRATTPCRASTRSARWPRPPATTTPSAGGRTSSSTGRDAPSPFRGDRRGDGGAARATRRTRRSTRGAARTGARRTCARSCAPRARRASSGSPWSAAPGTPRRWPAAAARQPPTTALLQGPAEGEGRRRPGCRGPTRGWRARSGYGAGVTSPGWYHHLFGARRTGDVPPRWLGDGRPRRAARARTCRRPSAHVDRGGPAGRDAGRAARPAAGRASPR